MPNLFAFRKWFDHILIPVRADRRRAERKFRLRLEELENRLAPATTLSIADASMVEPPPNGTVNMDFTVTRTGDLTSQLTVGYTTVAGTAQPNTDFTPTTGTTTFAAGASTATIAIPIFGNGVFNTNLTFSVKLNPIIDASGPPVTFATHADFPTGSKPVSVAMADLNGDGLSDLVVVNSNTVSVLINTTTPGAIVPSFAVSQDFATLAQPLSLAVGDLNGDGKPDLVVTDGAAFASVFMNTTATGATTVSFAARQDFAVGAGIPTAVALGELNGDGVPDLVVLNQGSASVSVLLNTTPAGAFTASFSAPTAFSVGTNPSSVALGDFNGDGHLDLAVANGGSNSVSVLLNTTVPGASPPSFAAKQDFATGAQPVAMAVADINGDGKADLVTENSGSNNLSVLLNSTVTGATTLSFGAKQDFTAERIRRRSLSATLMVMANPIWLSRMGLPTPLRCWLTPQHRELQSASFTANQASAVGNGPVFLARNDVNGDGRPDLIAANETDNSVSVLLNTSSLGAAALSFPALQVISNEAAPVVLGDLNGDGKLDVVQGELFGANVVSVQLNTTQPGSANPAFTAPQSFGTSGNSVAVALGDFTGAGRLDVAYAAFGNSVSVLLNTTAPGSTTASFVAPQTFAVGDGVHALAVADINGDGKPDLIISNYSGSVSVLLNTTAPGATTLSFATQQIFSTGLGSDAVAVEDLNGDGRPDLIVANYDAATVSVLLNATAPAQPSRPFMRSRLSPRKTSPSPWRWAI